MKLTITTTITINFIHPSRKLKLLFDHTTKNIIILSHDTHAHICSCYKQYTVRTIYCDVMPCLQDWCTSRTPAQMDRVRRSALPLLCFPALCPGRSCNRPSAVWKTSTLSCTEWHRTTGFWKRLWEGMFAVIDCYWCTQCFLWCSLSDWIYIWTFLCVCVCACVCVCVCVCKRER